MALYHVADPRKVTRFLADHLEPQERLALCDLHIEDRTDEYPLFLLTAHRPASG